MLTEENKKLLEDDPDFVVARRYGNSVARLRERYPDGCPDKIVAVVLGMTEQELEFAWEDIVATLQEEMGVGDLL